MAIKTKTNSSFAHWIRRLIHINQIWFPLLYYNFDHIYQGINKNYIVIFICLLIMLIEAIRLKYKILFFGQRPYENRQISAFAWSAWSISIVLLWAPPIGLYGAGLSFPLIASMSFIDPLLGELRRYKVSSWLCNILGLICCYALWLWAFNFFQIAIKYCILLPPLIVMSENLKLKWIDDNALMLFVPLVAANIIGNLCI